MGTFYVVATPIGNLQDISSRAVQVLTEVDAVFCEDTRVTAKLMAHLGLKKRLFTYHQHSAGDAASGIAQSLREGMSLALVSDAGTPGINDPGGRLVAQLIAAIPDLRVVPVPGAHAAAVLLSVAGFPADRYQYWGFVPHKKGRQTFFKDLAECPDTVVFYESKHRITKTLESLEQAMGAEGRLLVIGRELTKQFETVYRGTVVEVRQSVLAGELLGEFALALGPRNWK